MTIAYVSFSTMQNKFPLVVAPGVHEKNYAQLFSKVWDATTSLSKIVGVVYCHLVRGRESVAPNSTTFESVTPPKFCHSREWNTVSCYVVICISLMIQVLNISSYVCGHMCFLFCETHMFTSSLLFTFLLSSMSSSYSGGGFFIIFFILILGRLATF